MLDAVRIHQASDITVEFLKETITVTRATADNMMNILRGKKRGPSIVGEMGDFEEVIDKDFKVISNSAFFLGVSIGSTNIRVVLMGLDFKPIPRVDIENEYGFSEFAEMKGIDKDECELESYSFKTPKNNDDALAFNEIQELVKSIVGPFLYRHIDTLNGNLSSSKTFRLMGIGFAVTGPVNYAERKWLSAPRISHVNVFTLEDIMGRKMYSDAFNNDVFLSMDNNAKAAMVSEYQYIMEKKGNKEKKSYGVGIESKPGDTALLYVGTGIGMAAVIDRELLRGNNNFAGEIGQLRIYNEDDIGTFSKKNIMETRINNENEDSYYTYLPYILNTMTCVLGVERVILIGHSIKNNKTIDEFIQKLMDQRIGFTIGTTQSYCMPEKGRGISSTAALGAAIQAYFTMCNFDIVNIDSENRVNLARVISWPQKV